MNLQSFEALEQDEDFFEEEVQDLIVAGLVFDDEPEDEPERIADFMVQACFRQDDERAFFRHIFLAVPQPKKIFRLRGFEDSILYPREFRQRFRVPLPVLDLLEDKLHAVLAYPTMRNRPLSPRQQILIFLTFIGTNSFYHVLRECVGVTESTICRTVHR